MEDPKLLPEFTFFIKTLEKKLNKYIEWKGKKVDVKKILKKKYKKRKKRKKKMKRLMNE